MLSDTKSKPLVDPTDVETFETVFTRYYPLVYQLAYRCTGQRDEADDIAQEAFLCFYRTPPHAASDQERRAWLCRVTMNLGLIALCLVLSFVYVPLNGKAFQKCAKEGILIVFGESKSWAQ